MPSLRLGTPAGPSLETWVAERFPGRLAGLAGLPHLPPARALLLPRCGSVHTAGMRFAIDIAFLSWPPVRGRAAVVGFEAAVQPWRMARHRGRVAALEAGSGRLQALGVVPGQAVQVLDCGGSVSAPLTAGTRIAIP